MVDKSEFFWRNEFNRERALRIKADATIATQAARFLHVEISEQRAKRLTVKEPMQ
jgi:hypothetical protein